MFEHENLVNTEYNGFIMQYCMTLQQIVDFTTVVEEQQKIRGVHKLALSAVSHDAEVVAVVSIVVLHW